MPPAKWEIEVEPDEERASPPLFAEEPEEEEPEEEEEEGDAELEAVDPTALGIALDTPSLVEIRRYKKIVESWDGALLRPRMRGALDRILRELALSIRVKYGAEHYRQFQQMAGELMGLVRGVRGP